LFVQHARVKKKRINAKLTRRVFSTAFYAGDTPETIVGDSSTNQLSFCLGTNRFPGEFHRKGFNYMSAQLRRYLADSYFGEREFIAGPIKKDYAIQIDDLDDNDDLAQFCTMFVTVANGGKFVFEMLGRIPLTQEIVDLAEIYGGFVEREPAHIVFRLNLDQIEVLMDLARNIRKTSRAGMNAYNMNWHRVSARTISSIYRFVRIIREYCRTRGQVL
jgi:hypothetical protein